MLFGCKYISRGCIQVSMSVEEVLCEVLKHPKVTMLNLEQVEPPGHRVGRECDLVTAHLRTSAASSCVTMTQHHSHTDSRHREHTQEQSQSVWRQLAWDTGPAFSTVRHSCSCISDYIMRKQNLLSHCCWGEGELQNACCSTFTGLQRAWWSLLGAFRWRTMTEEQQRVQSLHVAEESRPLTPALQCQVVWPGCVTQAPATPRLMSQDIHDYFFSEEIDELY